MPIQAAGGGSAKGAAERLCTSALYDRINDNDSSGGGCARSPDRRDEQPFVCREFFVAKYCSVLLLAALTTVSGGESALAADVAPMAVIVAAPSDPLPATRDEEIRQEMENAVMNVHYPVFGVPALDEDMIRWTQEIAAAFQKDVAHMERVDEITQKSTLETSYAVHAPSAKAVSVTFTVWSYMAGAAHGAVDIRTRTYAMPAGARLQLADVFGDVEKALELMSAYALADLRARLGGETDDEWLQEGTLPHAENFSNVALTPAGVHIFFQAYQVGPWVIGPQEVDVPLETLREARPRMALWDKEETSEQKPEPAGDA